MEIEDHLDFEEDIPMPGLPSLAQELLEREAGDKWTPEQVDAAVDKLEGGGLRFPAGKRKVSPGLTPAIQLVLLDLAALEAVSTYGWPAVTVADITRCARQSRTILYYHYKDKEELFIRVLEKVVLCLNGRFERAVSKAESWSEQVCLAVEEGIRFVVEEPHPARALMIGARSAGKESAALYDEFLDHLAQGLDSLTREKAGGKFPSLTAEGVVGAITAILYLRLSKGEAVDPDGLRDSLLFHALAPYIGPTAALAERDAFTSR